MFTIQRTTGNICSRNKERLIIKSYKYADDMHEFLNSQDNNNWKASELGLKAGTYARVGGAWHNVRSLDASVLAHI